MENQDRAVRKAAYEAYSGFFKEHEADFDRIYDELVHVRDKMAKKIGYDNANTDMDYRTCKITINLSKQSPDIAIRSR